MLDNTLSIEMRIPKPGAQVRFLPGAFPLEEPKLPFIPANRQFSLPNRVAQLETASSRFRPLRRGRGGVAETSPGRSNRRVPRG